MSMRQVVARLNHALDQLDAARASLHKAMDQWGNASHVYLYTLNGSRQPRPNNVRAAISTIESEELLTGAAYAIGEIEAAIVTLLDRYGGERDPTPVETTIDRARQAPIVAANAYGDRYLPEAFDLICNLAPRVVSGAGDRTMGVARINGRATAPILSGGDRNLVPRIEARLASLGIRSPFLRYHVEMKVAMKMIETGHRDVQLAINNVPCGIEQLQAYADACDKVLGRFLPTGFVLTVYGTTQDNQPWVKTYVGQGARA